MYYIATETNMNSSGVSKKYKLDLIVMLAGGDKPDENIRDRYCLCLLL